MPDRAPSSNLSFRVPRRLVAALVARAAAEDRSLNEVVRAALGAFVAEPTALPLGGPDEIVKLPVSPELGRQLRELAAAADLPLSVVARLAVRHYTTSAAPNDVGCFDG